jgi:predicted TIM-barrel fold metal-dependent hydrolase
VTFIFDHCGVPPVKEKILDPWRSDLREIAKSPNVFCTISGLIAYADPHNWTAEDLRPYVDHAMECFGWDRVMFGSDWPVCTLSASYRPGRLLVRWRTRPLLGRLFPQLTMRPRRLHFDFH